MLSDVEKGNNLMLARLTPVATLLIGIKGFNPKAQSSCQQSEC